jgi:formate dehydrogenase accessory protein FdhE
MNTNEWQRRVIRAEEMAERHASAAEILRFYAAVARFQAEFYRELENSEWIGKAASSSDPFALWPDREVAGGLHRLLRVVEQSGPAKLGEAARELAARDEQAHLQLLSVFWENTSWENTGNAPAAGTDNFFARAYLQPYAVGIRTRARLRWNGPTAFVCPFCKRKPGLGVMRPLGEGSQRSLICSFCLAEWEFRRIVCPACGEEDPLKLPVYAAEELQHVRVEACDSCKCYIKTVDLTKSGLGEPLVDEMASVALDLWASEHGYAKLQINLLQL